MYYAVFVHHIMHYAHFRLFQSVLQGGSGAVNVAQGLLEVSQLFCSVL